ncbi:aminomethyltransferase [Rhodobium orientis]|uniref:aminomethyltransferase n=1 Tax=Rhodobium orientis TaxID=34017 RepID=A0A327JLV3_9HYPH|nr:glycine cleavage system aminomethyltransferase GcvT [Rhodobium orientis]MBB4304236.1 aminomethyltransferase [Rhodobium orientis]MBK5950705.1 glycine cleavage system protein T [Rhodobium orientis]RAI23998.1 glycine cleavage system protein T [Rhodobium orientis]
MADTTSETDLKQTPLHARHASLGARLVPFAGYQMPVQYEGILAEHTWTRGNAGLFDVSHMGQAFLAGPDHATTAAALEKLVPGDIAGLKPGRIRYTLLLNDAGGILDDLMVTRSADPSDDGRLYLVVNAANKDADYAVIRAALPPDISLAVAEDRALIAIQGPKAAEVMARHCEKCGDLSFMAASSAEFDGIDCHIGRSGYTGEDGFEISVAADRAVAVWDALVAEDEVKPVGLGARDSLRLEASLCLHGHDIDAGTTPVAADLLFAISKRRREEGGFPGAQKILAEMESGPAEKRVGLSLEGRAPAREGAEIMHDGKTVGRVTSGGFAPTVGAPIAMGYVAADLAATGTELDLMVRGRALKAKVVDMPFVPQRYYRKPK